jgi:spermidine synthase
MPTSLFIEHHANGLAFYINGDLQFDTADEALYHEYLVIPTVALAVGRFPHTDLRVLICGGGDGLAARDVLRFPEVQHIDLVDYSPDVLELGKTVFEPFNSSSLESDHLTVHTQEAFEFVSTIPDNFYHVIICDFTYPTCQEDTSIYSREWFQQIHRILIPSGIVSTNGVSPENRTTGFWCLYQTLLSAGLSVKPLQLAIPSFHRHGYGNWGFFLASPLAIARADLEFIALPNRLKALTHEQLFQAFVFPETIASVRQDVAIHALNYPQLFYYLLNPNCDLSVADNADRTIDFLEIEEFSNGLLAPRDFLKLESMAQMWLEEIYQSQNSRQSNPDINKLLPVQHRYHSPKMTREWLAYIKHLLSEIDLPQLLNSVLERSRELPPRMANELQQFAQTLRSGKPLPSLSPKMAEFIMMLSVTLLMANLVTPDTVFAKGSSSSGSSSYSGESDYDWSGWQIIGLFLAISGGVWLTDIFTRSRDE